MSVTKPVGLPVAYKDELWGAENISKWAAKILFDMLFFFLFYWIFDSQFDLANALYHFIVIYGCYILADGFSFFVAYVSIKAIFGLIFKRKVKPFFRTMKHKVSRKKLWIYLFTIVFETLFYVISLRILIVSYFPPEYTWLILLLIWIGLRTVAKGLAKLLYFIFYTF